MTGSAYLPSAEGSTCITFALARNAMYAACRMLGIGPGDEVLTPAFDCDGALQPFVVLGCRLQFFRSDPRTFAVDLTDLRARITPRTRLLHIVNHFGFPQPWEELLAIRRSMGVPILEDNAYSLFSLNEPPLGTFGDVSVCSLRKNLPLVDGGILRINRPGSRTPFPRRRQRWIDGMTAQEFIHAVKAGVGYHRLPESVRRFIRAHRPSSQPPPPLYSDAPFGVPPWSERDAIGKEFSRDYLRPMSHLARRQWSQMAPEEYTRIAHAKRHWYRWLSERLEGTSGVTVLWPTLPDGAVPFCLSLLLEAKRDLVLEALRRRYPVMAWPTLSQRVLDQLGQFPDVELLGRQLFQVNLPADTVCGDGFGRQLSEFVRDFTALSRRHLSRSSVAASEPSWIAVG